jgi:hypothetical protein
MEPATRVPLASVMCGREPEDVPPTKSEDAATKSDVPTAKTEDVPTWKSEDASPAASEEARGSALDDPLSTASIDQPSVLPGQLVCQDSLFAAFVAGVALGTDSVVPSQVASFTDRQPMPVNQQANQPIAIAVPVALERAEQLLHLSLGHSRTR